MKKYCSLPYLYIMQGKDKKNIITVKLKRVSMQVLFIIMFISVLGKVKIGVPETQQK